MSNDFIAYVQELFGEFGTVSARAMFGGHGLYFEGVLIGIVIEDGVYLKVDTQTQALFEQEGCQPYVYQHTAKPLTMSYWSVPDAAMDSPQAMLPWARLAYEAALRKPRAPKRAGNRAAKKAPPTR